MSASIITARACNESSELLFCRPGCGHFDLGRLRPWFLAQPPAAIQVTSSWKAKRDRSEPSPESKKIATLKAGEKLLIVGYRQAEGLLAVQLQVEAGYVTASRIPKRRTRRCDGSGNVVKPAPGEWAAPRLDNRAATAGPDHAVRQADRRQAHGRQNLGRHDQSDVIQHWRAQVGQKGGVQQHDQRNTGNTPTGRPYFEERHAEGIGGLPPGIQPLEPTRIPPVPQDRRAHTHPANGGRPYGWCGRSVTRGVEEEVAGNSGRPAGAPVAAEIPGSG